MIPNYTLCSKANIMELSSWQLCGRTFSRILRLAASVCILPPKMKLGANNRFLLYRNYIFTSGPRLLFAVFYGLDLFRLFGQKLKEKQVIWLE